MVREKSSRWDEYSGPLGEGTYSGLYNSHNWSRFAQQDRDDRTIEIGKTLPPDEIYSLGDMSAGGSRIPWEIAAYYDCETIDLGDYSAQYGYKRSGPMQETLLTCPRYDLYLCTETIEHLHDPDGALELIRPHAKYLLLTTPVSEKAEEVSHGHLWVWDREDVEDMLRAAEFEPFYFEHFLIFGMWLCR